MGGIQGTPADACIEILHANKISPIFKWVNNFVIFRSPSGSHSLPIGGTYDYDLACMMWITDPLGIHWHPISKKGQDFGPSFKYLGFPWNLADHSVMLPKEKQCRILLKLRLFLSKPHISQKDCTSLHGSLQHISFIYHDTWSALPALSAFL